MVLIKDFRNGFYDVIQHQVKRSVFSVGQVTVTQTGLTRLSQCQ